MEIRSFRSPLMVLSILFMAHAFSVQGRSLPMQHLADHPEKTIVNLHKIYRCWSLYRKKNHFCPGSSLDLLGDLLQYPSYYGIKDRKEAMSLLTNPDTQYSDRFRTIRGDIMVYNISNVRPDGAHIGDPKSVGTRDLILWTDLYVHSNSITTENRQSENPTGYYLVVWDDGSVDKIPYDQIMYAQKANSEFKVVFPGEAGAPSDALSYDDFYQKTLGWVKAPRTTADGKGVTYDGR